MLNAEHKFEHINVMQQKHLAIECYHQTTTCDFFESWFKNTLLKEIPKGHTVIMDNASVL